MALPDVRVSHLYIVLPSRTLRACVCVWMRGYKPVHQQEMTAVLTQ